MLTPAADYSRSGAVSGSIVRRASRLSSNDPQEFAALLTGFRVHYLPTTNDHRFTKVEFLLPSGRLLIVRRPPMIFEGVVSANASMITFSLDENPRGRIDGQRMAAGAIAILKQGTPYRGYEERSRTSCALLVSNAFLQRNWPEPSEREGYFSIGADTSTWLRWRVYELIGLFETDPARLTNPNVLRGIDQSITAGIDHALLAAVQVGSSVATGRYVSICRRAEEYLKESRYRIRSGSDVAAACGVNVRTLHNAFVSVVGMSLNRYLVLHRLWLTRQALLQADDEHLVKSIALDHGFWHLGRFSRLYHSMFGELPSTTLANRRSISGQPVPAGKPRDKFVR